MTFDKTMIIKTVWYWQRINKYMSGTGESRNRSRQNTVNRFWKRHQGSSMGISVDCARITVLLFFSCQVVDSL